MNRRFVIAAVVTLLGLPPLWTAIEAAAFHARNHNNGSIDRREYLLYVPPSYDPSRPAPLVISLHGAGGWPAQQSSLTRWNGLADDHGFLVVYPSGSGAPRVWHDGEPDRDVKFISDLVDRLQKEYNIDRTRVYANGFSNGGNMTFVLSCALSERIAAVGMVGAALSFPWSRCTAGRPVPMIAFHGTADPFAPYVGGHSPVAPEGVRFQNAPMWAARWARRNGCAPDPVDSAVAGGVTRRAYANCAAGADVVLYTIRGGGHQWFGGEPLPEWFVGPQSSSINATSQMWAFFCAHPLHQDRQAPRGATAP